MLISTSAQMRELDRRAESEYGLNESILMENAGIAAYEVIKNETGLTGKRIICICGTGNNGGDGLVVARKLFSMRVDVSVLIVGDPDRFSGSSKKNYEIIRKIGIHTRPVDSTKGIEEEIARIDVIVDALFGTGLDREILGLHAEIIWLINKSGKTIVSLDIPSGINGDTGCVMGIAVKAHYTIAFGLPKTGNLLFPGYEHCGKLFVSHISYPPHLYDNNTISTRINVCTLLPKRSMSGHKGSFGDILIVAGASGYYGAPRFSAMSFLKAGGGYCRLAAPQSIIPHIAQNAPEVVYIPLEETSGGSLSEKNLDKIMEISKRVDTVIVGPGLSIDEEAQKLVRLLVPLIEKPLIIDGDGITAISKDRNAIRARQHPTILTPHTGEMARLTDIPAGRLDDDRIGILQKTASDLDAIIVLKGAHSLIGLPDGSVFINTSGNSGMATAGSGDALTGTICAMTGLGLPIEDAVRTGVFIHGLAGDIAKESKGEDGMTAIDIVEALPQAVMRFRENHDALAKNSYGTVFAV
jgi:hydroxyethylthiazole kinase-like uncharacterized protein yjeF